MPEDLTLFSSPELKDITQDMRELLSHSHIAFLLGAGCSSGAGLPLMPTLTEEVLQSDALTQNTKKLLESVCSHFEGAQGTTIEDYMSELVDYLSIAERRLQRGAAKPTVVVDDDEYAVDAIASALDQIKQVVAKAIYDKDINISFHQQFVRAIHGSLQAGKSRRLVNYFILNYDTLIEDALGLEQVPYIDGFTGAATGWWNPSVFSRSAIDARVFKVHGSIDWCLLERDPLPRRIRPGIQTGRGENHVLIFPAATKYRESQRDPFAQLIQQMRNALHPAEGEETVLAICGYSFGDSHIDCEIESGLYGSEGRLTVAAFISDDEPKGTLKKWVEDPDISSQVKIYSNKGYSHSSNQVLLKDVSVPWWKFEVLVSLLGGEK